MRHLFAALCAALLALTGVAYARDTAEIAGDLPDIGTPANTVMTRTDEYQIGRMIVRGLRDQKQVLDDPEISDYLQHLGNRLAAQGRRDNQSFEYFVVPDRTINAFALPGGFIGVNAGLILMSHDESQLASVLAHETAHVQQRHIARAIQAQGQATLASTAALLAAILIGAAAGGGGQAIEGAVAMSQGIAMQRSINFTRLEEAEADRVGMGLLAAAGYNPYAMPEFFEAMGRSEGLTDASALDLLRTHPVTRERIADARARAAQYSYTTAAESSLYPWMRERLRVVTADAGSDPLAYYSGVARRRGLSEAERYGQALALARDGRAADALPALRTLLDAHPDITALYGSLGQALMAAGRQDEALQLFERAAQLFPRNVPLTIRYSEALMQAGRARQAHHLLLDVFNVIAPTPQQIRLTALAASAAGDTADAYFYMSEYHISGGDLMLATQQLELALASPRLTSVQRQRFRARLEEVRDWLREERRMRPARTSGGSGQ
ncbi:MAG: M48 family metalloprotease [Gammaproteobacteria bacterium]|nr:M48 family metalloprotease [Gammaproteobacteria bacterium]